MSFHFKVIITIFLSIFGLATNLAAQDCVTASTGSLTYDGVPFRDRPSNYFTTGDTIEVCFSLDDQFQTPDQEWVHSIIVDAVGSGFNFASITSSGLPPAACRATGNWAFYETWSRCGGSLSCPGPTTFSNGYAFDSTEGTGDACNNTGGGLDEDPGNNWGDGDGSCGLVFCFALEAINPGGLTPAEAYAVSVQVLADGVSGGYTGSDGACGGPCNDDVAVCFPEIGMIDVDYLNEPCPGDLFDLQAVFADGSNFNGISVIWRDGSGAQVAVGEFVSLPEGLYTLEVSRPNCAPQTFDVDLDLSIPVLEYMGPEDGDLICYGQPINMSIVVTNATVNSINWTLDGNQVSTGTSYTVAQATPSNAGEYSVNVDYGDGCDTSFVFDLFVGENIEVAITPAGASYCEGDIVTFTAEQTNEGPFSDDLTLLWDGGAGEGPSYIFEAFGTGASSVDFEVIDADGCVFTFNHPYLVNALPEGILSPVDQNICSGDSTTIVVTPSGGTGPYTFRWEPEDVGVGNTYTVAPLYTLPSAGVDVLIIDANGCIGYTQSSATVTINDIPTRPALSCEEVCVSEILFTWNQAGANFYHLFVRINGAPEVQISDDYTEREYLFAGLNPGDEVELRVVPFAGDATNSCEGPDRSRACSTPLTSTPGFVVDFPSPVCVGENGAPIELEISAGEPGTFALSSASLSLSGLMADADGSTTITLPAPAAGSNTQTHTITIDYEGVGGRCPSDTTIQITAIRAPDAEFTLNQNTACGFSAVYTATLATPATATDVYTLVLEDPAVGQIVPNGSGVWDVTINEVGSHSLLMTTQNALGSACADTFRTQITLAAPAPAPMVQCGSVGLDFINFIWNDTGHDSYVVNEIDVPAGAVLTRNGNSVEITNLSVDDIVRISVTGITAGCPNITSEVQTCIAESCPDITLSIIDPGAFCASVDQEISLDTTAIGSDGSGVLTWEIDGTAFSGTFNPSDLGTGSYTIDALLDEGCDFRASLQLVINSVPSAAFSLPNGPICTGTQVLGAAAGAAQAGFTYNFSAPGATATAGVDDASENFSWAAPGRYFVSLTVTSDQDCVSETLTDSIDVVAPLVTPVVTCDTVDMAFVVFTWPAQPGADGFAISVDNGPVFFQDSTTLFVGGLSVSQTVSIIVEAIDNGPCANPAPGTTSCTTVACPQLMLTAPQDTLFCTIDAPLRYLLVAGVSGDNGGGTTIFDGPGVVLDGSDYFFDLDLAGEGSHEITVEFEEGMCTGMQTFTYIVNPTPESDFEINGTPSAELNEGVPSIEICAGDSFVVEYTGGLTASDSAVFCYSYSPEVPIVIDTLGFENYTCQFPNPGTYRVCLEVKLDSCTSTKNFFDIICVSPPPPPLVTCTPMGNSSVVFNWLAVPDASGYQIIFDDGTTELTNELSYTATGLLPGESFGIEVIAISSNACDDSGSAGRVECSPDPCPLLTADLSSIPAQICIFDSTETISLTEILVSGGIGGGDYSFSGPGITGITQDTFFVPTDATSEAGITYTILLNYEEAGPCTLDTTFDITVFQRPTAFFIQPGTQCLGDTTLIRVGSTNFVNSNDVTTDFADGVVVPDGNPNDTQYLVVFPTEGPRTITATVISNISGCPSEPTTLEINVVAPLPAPALMCGTATLETVEVTWTNIPDATSFLVSTSNGQNETLPAGTTSYEATGMLPSTDVTFTVTALGDAPCGDGPEQMITCRTMDCPGGVVQADTPAGSQCLNGTETPVLLEASLTSGDPFNGTVSWMGTGVVDNGNGTFSFDPAGLSAGDYTVTVNYDGPANCDSQAELVLTLNEVPTVTVSASQTQLCVGQTTTVAFTGAAQAGASFDWDFGDATATDLGNESYELSWGASGPQTVSLVVTDNCTDSITLNFALDAILDTPLPECAQRDLDGVTFSWPPVLGATSYRYQINDGGFVEQAGTTVRVDDLAFGEAVSITVIALRTGTTCDESSASTLVECSARECPDVTFAPAAAQTDFCEDDTVPVVLDANLSGDDGTGVLVWSGDGVAENNGVFTFDPVLAGLGNHVLSVRYVQEQLCIYEDNLEVNVFALPVVTFNAMPTQLCQGEEFNLFFTGTAADGDEFVWNFDGAVENDLGMENYLLRWDTPGDRTVTLTVNGNCTATASFDITITPTLPAPVVTCTRQDLDGVFFTWPVVTEATEGYRVSINGGPYGDIQTNTDFFVDNLAFGENVTLRVISVRSGTTCDESAPSTATNCAARECPMVTFAPATPQDLFCDEDTDPVVINANLSGDDGTGVLVWSGDGVVENNGVFTFDPVMAGVGVHTLTVSYTQEALCIYTETLVMTVNASPIAAIGQSTVVTCAGTSVSFGLNGTLDPATEYTFDFGTASVNDLGNENYEVTFAAGGEYTISLRAERNGCVSRTSSMLTVEEEVFAGTPVNGVLEACASAEEPINLTSRINNPAPGGTWSTVSGGVPAGNLDANTGVLRTTGLGAGDYTFAYTVDGGSCPEDAAEVMVNLLAAPVANAGPAQTLTCRMGMVSLDGSDSETGNGYSYLWTSADPSIIIADADQQMIDVGQPGVYQLRVTNAIGCSAVSEVTVSAETEAPVMELEVSNITCFSSDNGAISVTNVNGGRPPYSFSINGEDRGQSTLFANLEPGAYDVQITDANGCFSNVILDLSEPDELTVRLQFPGDSATTTAGTEIFITATVNGGNPLDTLLWQPDSITLGDGQNGIQFTATETQMISVTVVDELGCSASDQMMLLVRRDRPVYFPTAFSPNGDNNNDIFFIGGDLDQIDFITDFFIFNRWGEAVYNGEQNRADGMGLTTGEGFLPNDPAFGWDGMLNGALLNPQVLVYTATVHFSDGEVVVYKGDFVLMR